MFFQINFLKSVEFFFGFRVFVLVSVGSFSVFFLKKNSCFEGTGAL